MRIVTVKTCSGLLTFLWLNGTLLPESVLHNGLVRAAEVQKSPILPDNPSSADTESSKEPASVART